MEIILSLAIYYYIYWNIRFLPSQMPTSLLTTTLILGLHYYLSRKNFYSRWPSRSNCHVSVYTTHNRV